ncbi:MAG: cytidylate kinase-like family protein [Clostridia bacterium]|nr:cytidylate kinase-like family protein [Clostridia bacterium]
MKNHVVTIARSYGSAGQKVGTMLAEKLGYELYDRNIIQMAAEESGIDEKNFEKANASKIRMPLLPNAKKMYIDIVHDKDSGQYESKENLFRFQAKIIQDLASEKDCVILGRCSNHVLRGLNNVARVYISSPIWQCVRNVSEAEGLTAEEAEEKIAKMDKQRADYFKYFTGEMWQDPANYDLCLNTVSLSEEDCVDMIVEYMHKRFKL